MPLTRRRFLQHSIGGSTLLCSIVEGWHDLLRAMSSEEPNYDLLVKGGKAIDPSQGLSAERDVAILGSKIARVAVNIPEGEARQVLNARGKIVTPGLIDIHVHVYEGVTTYGIPLIRTVSPKGSRLWWTQAQQGRTPFRAFAGMSSMWRLHESSPF